MLRELLFSVNTGVPNKQWRQIIGYYRIRMYVYLRIHLNQQGNFLYRPLQVFKVFKRGLKD